MKENYRIEDNNLWFRSFLKLFLSKKKYLFIVIFFTTILSILTTKFQKKLYEIKSEILINYHPIESQLNCSFSKSNFNCLNQNTISLLITNMEKEFLIKNKFKSLSLDYYELKNVDDFKIFNSIINNSKFNITLTTRTLKDKKYYQDQFKYIEEEFDLNTINDVKNEKKLNEYVDNSFTNELKNYTGKNKNEKIIAISSLSDNSFRREINRILLKNERGLKPIVFRNTKVKSKNLSFLENFLFFNFGGIFLFIILIIINTQEIKSDKKI